MGFGVGVLTNNRFILPSYLIELAYTLSIHLQISYIVGLKAASNTRCQKIFLSMIVDDIRDFVGDITNGSERLIDLGMVVGFLGAIFHTSLLYVAFV